MSDEQEQQNDFASEEFLHDLEGRLAPLIDAEFELYSASQLIETEFHLRREADRHPYHATKARVNKNRVLRHFARRDLYQKIKLLINNLPSKMPGGWQWDSLQAQCAGPQDDPTVVENNEFLTHLEGVLVHCGYIEIATQIGQRSNQRNPESEGPMEHPRDALVIADVYLRLRALGHDGQQLRS